MRRTIVEPADVSGAPLAELKTWLGISRPNEDELLISLLLTSLDTCEAYTGQAPLSQLFQERIPVRAGRYSLTSRPITALLQAEVVAQDGALTALGSEDFVFELDANGHATFRLFADAEGQAVALQVQTGLAANWDTIPAALKQGLIRLAAFHYRDRDRTGNSKKDAASAPASVTALWRPWRTVRLQ